MMRNQNQFSLLTQFGRGTVARLVVTQHVDLAYFGPTGSIKCVDHKDLEPTECEYAAGQMSHFISPEIMRAFLLKLRDAGIKPTIVRVDQAYWSIVKDVFSWAVPPSSRQ